MALVTARDEVGAVIATLVTYETKPEDAVEATLAFAEENKDDPERSLVSRIALKLFRLADHYVIVDGDFWTNEKRVDLPLRRKYGVDLDFALTVEAGSQEEAEDLAGEAVRAVETVLGEAIHYNIEVREA